MSQDLSQVKASYWNISSHLFLLKPGLWSVVHVAWCRHPPSQQHWRVSRLLARLLPGPIIEWIWCAANHVFWYKSRFLDIVHIKRLKHKNIKWRDVGGHECIYLLPSWWKWYGHSFLKQTQLVWHMLGLGAYVTGSFSEAIPSWPAQHVPSPNP